MSCHRSRCSLRNWNIDYAELWSYLVVWERWLRGENVPFFQSRSNGVGSSGSSSRDTYMGMKYDICSEPTKLSMDSIPLYSGLLLSSLLFLLENFPLIDRKGPCQHSFQCRVFSLQRPRLLSTFARCLKIPAKVSFYNIASEASYVYILSIKVIKIPKMVNLTSFWKTEAYSQLVLPDRSTSKEQKLVENLMTFFEPFFPTVHYYPIPFVS